MDSVRNAYFAMPIAYDADDAYRDALRLLRTNALAIRLKRLRETERIKIHFNNWEPEEGTPLDKWRSIWVESGVAEELPGRNNLKLLLPKSLKDIEGALHNIDDIRSTPHGNATFNLRAAVRAAAGGIGDRGRAGDGIGRDRDRNQRYAAAVVVST